ncbi:MAG TPA: hypothetical protein VG755_37515 [Nannocystaceae bacterium]|nr:hypothetical protein [Nannocystaceae bacterium]
MRPAADDGGDEKGDDPKDDEGDEELEPTMIVGTVYAFVEGNPIAGARVCVLGPEDMPCVESGGDGRYALPELDPEIQVGVTAEADGYVSAVAWGLTTDGEMGVDVGMLSTAAADAFATAIGTPFDSSKAQIAIGANDGSSPIAGVSWTIDPASGVQAYVGDDGLPTTALHATTASGIGGFINVDGDTVELAVTREGASCFASALALPGAADNSTRLPLLAGHFNGVIGGFTCM